MKKLYILMNVTLKNLKYYSLNMFFCKVLFKLFHNEKIKKKWMQKYKYYLEKGICKRYNSIILKYANKDNHLNLERNNKTIWVFWWQGIENAPKIVKQCVYSLKNLNRDYKLNVISKDNFKEYINLSDVIIKKFNSGKIGFAHFSDIIRVNLLSEYGGIWADATIFLTKGFNEDILDYNFYSIKSYKSNTDNVSEYRWTTYFLCAKRNNELLNFLKELFNAYYEDNDYVIDYLMFDYFIDIAYNNIDYIKEMIDKVPINNIYSEKLSANLNNKFNEKIFKEIISNTYIHKLTYKVDISEDKNTFYHKIIDND